MVPEVSYQRCSRFVPGATEPSLAGFGHVLGTPGWNHPPARRKERFITVLRAACFAPSAKVPRPGTRRYRDLFHPSSFATPSNSARADRTPLSRSTTAWFVLAHDFTGLPSTSLHRRSSTATPDA